MRGTFVPPRTQSLLTSSAQRTKYPRPIERGSRAAVWAQWPTRPLLGRGERTGVGVPATALAEENGRCTVMDLHESDDQVTTPGVRIAVFGVGAVPARRKMTELDPTELNWTGS